MRSVSIELTEAQKQALVDLLVLGMYADHNLSAAEDDYLQRLLDTFEFSSDYSRQAFIDAAFTRTRGHANSLESVGAYLEELAGQFPSAEDRRAVCEALDELLASDGGVSTAKNKVLSLVREIFAMPGRVHSSRGRRASRHGRL
jgi:hypothetical protein